MHSKYVSAALSLGLASLCAARDVPDNVQALYNSVTSGDCSDKLVDGFYDQDDGSDADFNYCGDHLDDKGIVYIKGPRSALANMDIDCDGQTGDANDGRCGSAGDQGITAFQDQVSNYGIDDLNPFIHNYVVFGNDDTDPSFNPQDYGIEPLSLMAVVCGDKMFYGIWGDTNGNDGPPLVGEASIGMATLCYGDSVNDNSGHDETDVLYIAFAGSKAVPGGDGADWQASSSEDFEDSLTSLGDSLTSAL